MVVSTFMPFQPVHDAIHLSVECRMPPQGNVTVAPRLLIGELYPVASTAFGAI